MTRPPGASFAQFFPTAPRAARDRAIERERARTKDSPSTRAADTNGHLTPSGSSADQVTGASIGAVATSNYLPNGMVADAAPPLPADDAESLAGDMLNTLGSESSHGSTSSSLFSTSTQNAIAAMRNSNHYLTPLTTIDSPSSSIPTAALSKAQSTTPQHPDGPAGFGNEISAALAGSIERVPARDPNHSTKCVQCVYDPLQDHKIPSAERKKAKPIYKEFGLVRTLNNHTEGGGGASSLL